MSRTYIAIDLKSFYASVECVARGLDPLTTNLVVADLSRTEKTICLAVSPSLKAYGIAGRARLFEVVQQVNRVNAERLRNAPGHRFSGVATQDPEVQADPSKALGYLVASPRMAHYLKTSRQIYEIYLKYVSPEDIHVYSVDEVFIDATEYMRIYRLSAHDLAMRMIRDVLAVTGITATAGIGPNLYLAKIAMDIEAKHSPPDKDGVRIAFLDEMSYRRKYWCHRPLTDFWRTGRGIAAKLEANGMYTMGDIARCSVGKDTQRLNENLLYKLFGVNAELIIDHAWGWEPCTMKDIKSYRPEGHSLSVGQVLTEPYTASKARTVALEMTDQLVMEMVDQRVVADQMTLTLIYEKDAAKHAHGSVNLGRQSSSSELIINAMGKLFDRIADKKLMIRRIYVVANHVKDEASSDGVQLDLFEDTGKAERERKRQEAILEIRRKFGRNAILKGMNFEEGATARERNKQIGGHKA